MPLRWPGRLWDGREQRMLCLSVVLSKHLSWAFGCAALEGDLLHRSQTFLSFFSVPADVTIVGRRSEEPMFSSNHVFHTKHLGKPMLCREAQQVGANGKGTHPWSAQAPCLVAVLCHWPTIGLWLCIHRLDTCCIMSTSNTLVALVHVCKVCASGADCRDRLLVHTSWAVPVV